MGFCFGAFVMAMMAARRMDDLRVELKRARDDAEYQRRVVAQHEWEAGVIFLTDSELEAMYRRPA